MNNRVVFNICGEQPMNIAGEHGQVKVFLNTFSKEEEGMIWPCAVGGEHRCLAEKVIVLQEHATSRM